MRILSLFIIITLSLALFGGCFDYEYKLKLNRNGSGEVVFTLITPSSVTPGWEDALVARIVEPQAERGRQELNGHTQLTEKVVFQYLGLLQTNNVNITLTIDDTGYLGLTNYGYILRTTFYSPDNIAPMRHVPPGYEAYPLPVSKPKNEAQTQAQKLQAKVFHDRFITVIQTMPGAIYQAEPVYLGAYTVQPHIIDDTVTWKIPLDILLLENVRYDLTFSCSFRGPFDPRRTYEPAWSSVKTK